MTRWTLDLSKPDVGFQEDILSPVIGEMPKIDERYATEPYRHGFLLAPILAVAVRDYLSGAAIDSPLLVRM